MASAAAVQADISREPLPNNLGDPGRDITGVIGSKHDFVGDLEGATEEGSKEIIEDYNTTDEKATGDDLQDEDEAADPQDDLFGEDEDDQLPSATQPRRQLDDEELDSGDDLGRDDRMMEDGDQDEVEAPAHEFSYMETELSRHPIPEPSDGELYLLKVPRFLSIDPHAWDHKTFQPPKVDHHAKTGSTPSSTFSAYNTALTTVRWRRSPKDPLHLQSNARVLRWADGSLTLQFASTPQIQYQLPGNPLAPPQQNPSKPISTATSDRRGKPTANNTSYNAKQDSFTYLAAPQASAQLVRVTNKVTTALTVQPPDETTDDALERLQNSLAAAVKGREGGSGGKLISLTEDPELAKKKAEVAEKEKLRAQRRREAQEQRERERVNRTLGRSGPRTGLTVGGLEDDELGVGAPVDHERKGLAHEDNDVTWTSTAAARRWVAEGDTPERTSTTRKTTSLLQVTRKSR